MMIRDFIVWLRFTLLRATERVLPINVFYASLKPYAFFHALLRKPEPLPPVPRYLGSATTPRDARTQRMRTYLNVKAEAFPDRLITPKWAGRLRVHGAEHWEASRRQGRPVIFAICHFGPYALLRALLHAAGIPVTAFVAGEARTRSKWNRLIDSRSLFPEFPTAFHEDQLKQAARFLADGNNLLIAIDQWTGKQMDVPLEDGWVFQMATGMIRLAERYNADLIPCCVVDEGNWHFRLEIGAPVPRELLVESEWPRAGRHLLNQMLPHFRAHPEQCFRQLARRFQQRAPRAVIATRPDRARR